MKTKDWLAFISLSLAWGSSFLWIKIAVQEIGPFLLVALRILTGILGLLVVVAIKRPPWPSTSRQWGILAVMGMLNVALPFTLISWGQQYIDSAVTSVLNSSVPIFTVLIAHFWLDDEKITGPRAFAILLGFAGVVVLVSRDMRAGLEAGVVGQLAVLVAAVFYAVSAVFIRRHGSGIDATIKSIGPLLFADAALWIATPMVESPVTLPALPLTWAAILWLGIIGSCIAYLLYFYLITSIGATRSTMVVYTFPVVGVILGVLFLGEVLDGSLMLGGGLAIASIILINRK